MTRVTTTAEWARRRRHAGTVLIIAGPVLAAAGIVATDVAQFISHIWFYGFQSAGLLLFGSGVMARKRADPMFAPSRIQDSDVSLGGGTEPPKE